VGDLWNEMIDLMNYEIKCNKWHSASRCSAHIPDQNTIRV